MSEVKTDKQGRIVDKMGRPLRDRRHRDHGAVPFRGGPGGEHPNAARLAARQKAYDDAKGARGWRRPGSYNK